MFQEFVKKLREELNKKLPGFSAQKLMAPLGRKPPLEYLQEGIVPKKSAVLILLYPSNASSIKTVLILRSEGEGGNHAGQISFPGGSYDKSDSDLSVTALRETEEEIGIERTTVSILGELSPLYIPVSNFIVHPYIGVTDAQPRFNIHALEVQEVLEVEIDELLSDKNRSSIERFIKIKGSTIQVPCYDIKGKIIWGATAMIIAEFVEIIRRIE
jgi:8-oxo-dGTP pyrophosphatase MutT (NUDIX family)